MKVQLPLTHMNTNTRNHFIAFCVSAGLHVALFLYWLLGSGQPTAAVNTTAAEAALPLSLAMFQQKTDEAEEVVVEGDAAEDVIVEDVVVHETQVKEAVVNNAETKPPVEATPPPPAPLSQPVQQKTLVEQQPLELTKPVPKNSEAQKQKQQKDREQIVAQPEAVTDQKNAVQKPAHDAIQEFESATAVAAAPVVSSAPVSLEAGFIASLEDEYKEALRRAIEAEKFYPKRARRLRREGFVLVDFIIDSAGFIHRVQVSQSSGTELLDTAAIEAVKRLGRYLPIPPELQRQQWSLEIPIEYSLL